MMEIVHIFGVEMSKVMLDNLILLLWTLVFGGLGYVIGRVHAEMIRCKLQARLSQKDW